MSKESLVTSVRQRLNRIAKENQLDFNSVQLRYVQERFLFRLSKSTYKNAFILKGALLFLAYGIPTLRPTKDIDFLGSQLTNNAEEVKAIIKEICEVEDADGVEFDSKSVNVESITLERQHRGQRIKLVAFIGTARITLQLDIAFGDIVVPKAIELEFPKLLDFEAPLIKTYSLESAIAEKFEVCVKLNFDSSRMKDFYDIFKIASHNSFDSSKLNEAFMETFSSRSTDIENREVIFSDEFKSDENKQKQWGAFQNRTGLILDLNFGETIDKIIVFIEGSLTSENISKKWIPGSWKWE
ncbi:MAG: nucleotidyl transferase AbiEii/AbiGii toxin family protein [Ignavibacteriae bacterium]|nr:nucleotidyl transferase AbiEii/AbiGii toxin family protein [Ignavibacteriota bacterium]NOG99109.1 nucleotidyl transferase AbiEii/AbiGii toxin family protein [Ignavibacteriota bacterium]